MESERTAPECAAAGRVRARSRWLSMLPALTAVCLVMTGCQTFNCTDENLARERQLLKESYDKDGWRGLSEGLGGMTGGGFSPTTGNIAFRK